MLNRKFFSSIAINVVKRYRKHIFDPAGGGSGARDVKGNTYKAYTSKYSIAKKSAKLKRSHSKFAKSNAPVLTGDLLNDFQGFNLISGGFRFGTLTQGGKVQNLTRLGRVIATDKNPLPKEVEKYIMKEADKYVKKELGKIKGGTFNR